MSTLALITGASGGIGEELARIMAREKHDLILVARSKEKLEKLAKELQSKHGIRCTVVDLDLSRHGSALELYNRVTSLNLQPDFLVNNAGFGEVGLFAETETKKLDEMISLNIETLTLLTRYFLPDFLKRKSGRILNVASTAAFLPGPFMAVYYATKAFVLHFTEAIAVELKGTGVTASALCPGPTPSGFQERSNMHNGLMGLPGVLSAAIVAEAGYKTMMKGHVYHIPGFANWFGAFIIRFSPRWMAPLIVARLNRNRGR
jgi:uncharacterized protein